MPHAKPSSPALGGDPLFQRQLWQFEMWRRTGSPAFAGDDGRREPRERAHPHNIPLSSSSAFAINSPLTTTSRRGTRKNIAEAQAIESAKIAAVSGSVVVE